MLKDIIAITTVRQGSPLNLSEKIRSEVFLDTAKSLSIFGIPCIAIFTECESCYLETIQRLGVIVIPQQSYGMGNIRREALLSGMTMFPAASFYVWLEPEKPHIIPFVKLLTQLMRDKNAVMGLFNRIRMDSYPEEQAYYYLFCRSVASKVVGFDLDYGFGPMILTKETIPYFLEYKGEYGDKWESILIPRLRVIKDGASIVIAPVGFRNDPRMTAIESGNSVFILKRIEQLNNVIPSLIAEWQKLSA